MNNRNQVRIATIIGVAVIMLVIGVALGSLAFPTTKTETTTNATTITISNSVDLVTVTEEIIGAVTPETATLTIIVSPNCTVIIPTLPIFDYNSTIFILPQENASSAFSIVSTFTTFSQMPNAQTAYTTISESNAGVKTTITSGSTTITSSTCPSYA